MPQVVETFRATDFPARRVLAAKGATSVSVVIPARDEEATVGAVVATLRAELMVRHPVIDEIVVVDDGSVDATARRAVEAGATVVTTSAGAGPPLQQRGPPGRGKGEALWRGVHATTGDVVAFCDADVINLSAPFILGLVGPLLVHGDLALVKAAYRRSYQGRPGEGGRVTELSARPALSLLFPQLAAVSQPLGGEYASPREVLESVPFVGGYGVDVGLLIDIAAARGAAAIAECDVGERVHRNRSLAELGPQAKTVLGVILSRAGVEVAGGPPPECPPLDSVDSYRRTA
jgi:glucosyl-3-phosphoglycerate synthase